MPFVEIENNPHPFPVYTEESIFELVDELLDLGLEYEELATLAAQGVIFGATISDIFQRANGDAQVLAEAIEDYLGYRNLL